MVEANYHLLDIATRPNIPASVQSIPDRYNIPLRLWSIGFHRLIATLRRASAAAEASLTSTPSSENAPLEILTSYIFYAYKFYTQLYEEENLKGYKAKWIEALGDLASYSWRLMLRNSTSRGDESSSAGTLREVTSLNIAASQAQTLPNSLRPLPLASAPATSMIPQDSSSTSSPSTDRVMHEDFDEVVADTPSHPHQQTFAPRILSPVPSIGPHAARQILPAGEADEREIWRSTAKEWYAEGLKDTPGAGRLQHHLGTLERDLLASTSSSAGENSRSSATVDPLAGVAEEIRAVYHFVRR